MESQPKGPPRTGLRAAAVVKDQQEAHVPAEQYMRVRQEAREAVEEPCYFPRRPREDSGHTVILPCAAVVGRRASASEAVSQEKSSSDALVSGPEKMEQQRQTKSE